MRNRLIILIVALLGSIGVSRAQDTEYAAELDTNYIMIGDQIHLKMMVRTSPGVKVVFPRLNDTITRGVEIISGPVRDSIRDKDGRILIQESYLVTAFDSGMYVIPPMPIKVERENYNNVLRTDPLPLVVNTYVVDQQKGNYDIVMPVATPWTFAEILPYLWWVLGGVLVVLLVVWMIIRYRSKKPLFAKEEPVIPPYELAIQTLNEIKEGKLWQSGRTKEYYTRLTEAIRMYLDGELEIPAMEQTSFEILRALEKCPNVDAQQREKLAMMLETSDFVKFAKATPLPDENTRNLDIAYDFVNVTNERVQEVRAKEQAEREARERAAQEEREQAEREAREKEDKNDEKN